MSEDDKIIRQSMRELDRLKCRGMSDFQLITNVQTYPAAGANAEWRQRCVDELTFRGITVP